MDYEKKYKEALARAKRLHSEPTGGTERIVCEQMFPELKENEDKIYRRAIRQMYSFLPNKPTYIGDVRVEDIFSWLGKQGEHKPQGKTALEAINEEKVDNANKVEQKPAWSEDDEYWSERLLGWLDTLINYIHYDSMVSLDLRRERIQQVEQIKTWLKSLKGRVGCEANCTTTKEWSEEDIATISRVISIVKWAAYSDHSHPILNDEGATELVERLKSLKERYTWKPSDEQMNTLEHYMVTLVCNEHKEILFGLYEDLKKLK